MKKVAAFLLFLSLLLLLTWAIVRPTQTSNGIGSQATIVCYISGTEDYSIFRGVLRSKQGSNYRLTVNGADVSLPKSTCSLK